jgi:hypothetical protein
MMIEALPAWQSHYSIAAIGNLYVAPSRPLRAVGLSSINSFELASRRDLASLRCGAPTVSMVRSAVARSAKSPATMCRGMRIRGCIARVVYVSLDALSVHADQHDFASRTPDIRRA